MKRLYFIGLAMCILLCSVCFCGCAADSPKDRPATDPETTMMSLESKRAVFNGDYGKTNEIDSSATYYGVGRTLDVIKDEYITVGAGYAKIFDVDKLLGLNWHKTRVGKMDAKSVSGTSMQKYYSNLFAKFNNSFDAKLGYGAFGVGIDSKFGFTADKSYEQTANEIFYTFSQMYAAELVEIDEYYNISQFTEILSYDMLEDADKVQSDRLSPAAFVYKYGTHVVLAGYYGGKVECDYYLRNMSKKWSVDTETNYSSGISASLGKIFNAQQNTDLSIRSELGLDSSEAQENFSASSIGGSNFKANSVSEFTANYKTWVESVNSIDEHATIVDLPKRSLAAIWDLLPDTYAVAANKLAAYFDEKASAASLEMLSKYERHFTQQEEKGDTDDFAQGYGTAADPYVITSKEQFLNINKENRNNKCFALGCSVNLGIWNDPFEFSGKLDGNGYTVSYTQTISSWSDYSRGLFERLTNAEVRRLKLDVKISRDRDDDSVGAVGALAGTASGECTIKQVYATGVISNGNAAGYDYIGGIVGIFRGGVIEQCANDVQVTDWARNARTGGICGYACPSDTAISIADCYNTGSLKSSSAWTTAFGGRTSGGIVGQARGHNAFTLSITRCYNDADLKLEWTGWATGGWRGIGGICGDIENNVSNNISVTDCYWDTDRSERYGNNGQFNANGVKDLGKVTYTGWSEQVWKIEPSVAPKLLWLL